MKIEQFRELEGRLTSGHIDIWFNKENDDDPIPEWHNGPDDARKYAALIEQAPIMLKALSAVLSQVKEWQSTGKLSAPSMIETISGIIEKTKGE